MKSRNGRWWTGVWLGLAIIGWTLPVSAAPKKSESDLIALLKSDNYQTVIDALDRLPDLYPHSTNALPEIKGLLKSTRSVPANVPAKIIPRKAARALGDYHAELDADDVKIIQGFLRSYDPGEVMDGLKTFRVLKEPKEIQDKIAESIVPLLKDSNDHIVRDACRTLAVVGSKEQIPQIEPLLKHPKMDVKKDAREAIATLKSKP